MDANDQTIQTYDESAAELAEFFKGIGSHVEDIERALELAGVEHSGRVVELGCGDGRDAVEIIDRTAWYEGFDPSEGLLELARNRLPDTSFVKADALSYEYPDNLDVVFAFASLLHVNRTDLGSVLEKIAKSLRPKGILYATFKERPDYQEELQEDEFGKRMFYYYNPATVKKLAGDAFTTVYEKHRTIGHTDWFAIALQKVS